MIAKKDIAKGEELCVTYVDPSMGLHERRRELKAWGFGLCTCKRCQEEEGVLQHSKSEESTENSLHPGLEDELRAGFGII